MQPRNYDFARSSPAIPGLAWVVLIAGALPLLLSVDDYTAAVEEHEQLLRTIGKLERRTRLEAAAASPASVQKSALAARREPVSFPWDSALRGIEQAMDRSVALTSLDTDVAQRRTRVVAEARSIEDAVAFATRLREAVLIRQVLLLSHETRKETIGNVISFTLQVDWSKE